MVLTGSAKAFAAAADIKEIQPKGLFSVVSWRTSSPALSSWLRPSTARKPIIAAVAGYALGGGAELAMMCDLIVAANNAKFGSPRSRSGSCAVLATRSA